MSTRIGDCSAADRNKGPIFDVLRPWLAGRRRVLEVGAGDATHARYARALFPELIWQASEAPGHHRRLVAAMADGGDIGLPAPLALDVRGVWPGVDYDAVYGANIAHIMDWPAVEALFAGASGCLARDGVLCLYGPFLATEEVAAPGNIAFDAALRARDPAMGLRRIDALDELAAAHMLERAADLAMPSNNRLLIWRRQADATVPV